jgi:DNA-directed RNA polymerase subunit beta'
MAFKKKMQKTDQSFESIAITLASPNDILDRSSGEVLKPETINYRTYKPEKDGLFCERIFGPVKDYECNCGKYKRIRYKGIICDRCGVEVTEKKVRRERVGHIRLVVPVVHIWFFRSLPNKLAYLLGFSSKLLDTIIYYERYVVIQAGEKANDGIEFMQLLSEEEYLAVLDTLPRENQMLEDSHPDKFIAKMGAEAIKDLLERINLDDLSAKLHFDAANENSQTKKADALKRLRVVEAFRDGLEQSAQRPEWTIVQYLPVIPPELRPLVPLDGGRFASSDLNDLYRRVIIRNNRLKRLLEIKAPEVILRNEKRMLQEAVDSLFDNSRKSNAVKADGGRALKSLSDILKGKQGRFRQNLLGKRVDYSGRSVIVVGPTLKLHECGIPKGMAAELFKPFIIRKLIERGIVKTVKSAKKQVDKKDPVVWEILENILRGHPVLLNRAPTLHRLGIQAFQPKLIEGKAIQLHPLVCAAFNADFDGDQMAVHVPLSHAAILEAQVLMLSSHNMLNPQDGSPITVPSQDMVLGLYYLTKPRKSIPESPVRGEGRRFYSTEEVIISYNEGQLDLHAEIECRVRVMENGEMVQRRLTTSVGRVLFNVAVPIGVPFINETITKKDMKRHITSVIEYTNMKVAAEFLDAIKDLGFYWAFKAGLSFNLGDLIIPDQKKTIIAKAQGNVDKTWDEYENGMLTPNERYNRIVDEWGKADSQLTDILMENLKEHKQGFNSVFMMLDSGARGNKTQIKQLCGIRGLMAKPRKSGDTGGAIIENPILSNFLEGLSVQEYFISTHGARKGLADTALKTADAGYLTRRLVDVAQDVVIREQDCGTLRGIETTAIFQGEKEIVSLQARIVGRYSQDEILHPETEAIVIPADSYITEQLAEAVKAAGVDKVIIRSVLTCESQSGVCAKCYGKNLATGRKAEMGDAAGIIAAQSIGEPGTQLTLRTFHTGGTAVLGQQDNSIAANYDGKLEFDSITYVDSKDELGNPQRVVTARTGEVRILDVKTNRMLTNIHIPYGSTIFVEDGKPVKKGDKVCEWDVFNTAIISEYKGIVQYQNLEDGVTCRTERDEQTGFAEIVIIESRTRRKTPALAILDAKTGEELKSYNLPVGAYVGPQDGEEVPVGFALAKMPRVVGKIADITGGLPRVTELFEARNPANPAVVAEIDGIVQFGAIKRGSRECTITSKDGKKVRKYMISLSKHTLVQDEDYVRSGTPLTDGSIAVKDILAIKGPYAAQSHLVEGVQEVYRAQNITINDKHLEVIVRQMMRRVEIVDPGDTHFLEGEAVERNEFIGMNDSLFDKKFVTEPGDSQRFKAGALVTLRQLREENSSLKRNDKKVIEWRDARPATGVSMLQGITKASLGTESWISAASFQETTKVISQAAIAAKKDMLNGLKENVIIGKRIPAGTGLRQYDRLQVSHKDRANWRNDEDVMMIDDED